MDPQLAAILTGVAAILLSVAECIRQVRSFHKTVDGRMDELLALTAKSARAEGKLDSDTIVVENSPTKRSVLLPSQRAGKLPHN